MCVSIWIYVICTHIYIRWHADELDSHTYLFTNESESQILNDNRFKALVHIKILTPTTHTQQMYIFPSQVELPDEFSNERKYFFLFAS